MDARGKYVLSQFGPFSGNCVSLVAGYAAGGSAQHTFPKQFVHYHRAGQASTSSPQTQRGYSAFVHTKISQVISSTSIHADTMSSGEMQRESQGKSIAVMLQDDVADARIFDQRRQGMTQSASSNAGSMNALRLPAFFESLGHSNVILTAASGSFGHKDGPASGAIACRQVEEAWKAWKSGQYGNVSLSDGVVEFAKTHEEIKGAFLTFPKEADEIYPGWKEKLGCTGVASVPASSVNAKISTASSAATAAARSGTLPAKMASQSTAGSVVNPYAGGVKSIQAASSNTAGTLLGTENKSPELSRQGHEAALQDSPKQKLDVRVVSQTDPQVNSSDKKMSMRIERASTDSQLVNPSAGLAKPSHAAGIGGSCTAADVLQRRGSMSLLEDPLGHTAQTVPQAQASGDKITETGSAMASGTQTGIDSVPGPVMKREVAWSCRTLLEDGPPLPLRFQAATEVPVSVKPDASSRRHTLPSSLLTRDPTKPRPQKTLRFSEHVDHRSISPRPRSATAPEASGTADKLRGKTMAAQGSARSSASKASTATKPVPAQSSSFSEFLFLPPVPENKTEPPPQSLSNFLFAPNGSTAQHAVPAVEMESSRRSGEEHHPSSAHHHSSDAHRRSSNAHHRSGEAHHRDRGSESHHRGNDTHHRSSEAHHRSSDAHHGHGRKRKHDDKHDKGIQQASSTTASASTSSSSSSAGEPASLASRGEVSGTMVHHSSSFQVTEEMAREAYERGLGCSMEQRVLERAYFLFQNGQSEDADANYFTALRIELSESG
ncbi:rbcG [Symbiodinium sp. CCMP2456]|nr:rbcG [Symbiodinium sp. CCMP2456]